MRGKVEIVHVNHDRIRITPAYAGKSHALKKFTELAGDHPRLCGEKSDRSATCFFKSGSPPPMRGKARNTARFHRKTRITPAYAGKSVEIRSSRPALRDHPRLCGEKHHRPTLLVERIGSPPPMRGKDIFKSFRCRFSRITPAYAGKSSTQRNVSVTA